MTRKGLARLIDAIEGELSMLDAVGAATDAHVDPPMRRTANDGAADAAGEADGGKASCETGGETGGAEGDTQPKRPSVRRVCTLRLCRAPESGAGEAPACESSPQGEQLHSTLSRLSKVLQGLVLRLGMRVAILDRSKDRLIAHLQAQRSASANRAAELEAELMRMRGDVRLRELAHADECARAYAEHRALKMHNAELMHAFAQQERLTDHLRKQLASAEALAAQQRIDLLGEASMLHLSIPSSTSGSLCSTSRSGSSTSSGGLAAAAGSVSERSKEDGLFERSSTTTPRWAETKPIAEVPML